jgi:glycosyltransferase involved in cell wall biosynthesis
MRRAYGVSLPRTLIDWLRYLALSSIALARLHRRRRYDVIHVNNLPDFLVFSAWWPKMRGARVILDVQDVSPELMAARAPRRLRVWTHRMAAWQEQLSTSFADYVITVGEPFERLLRQRGVADTKLTSIRNSADPRLFPPVREAPPARHLESGEPLMILLYHGTIGERQCLDVAVKALALVRERAPGVRLAVKGSGSQVVKQLAEQYRVADLVEVSDSVPISEVTDFIATGDIGIIPYRSDGFMDLLLPTKCYEYAWMRRPMIASNLAGIRSMFRPESIMLCEPSQPEAFAAAILDLYWNLEKRAALAANAAEDYCAYRWESQAEHYQQVLASLARRGAASAPSGHSLIAVPVKTSGV